MSSKYTKGPVSSAIKYFARVTIRGGLPVFPALVSLSCDAAGGKTKKTPSIGAALMLIAGAADIHDDIIDKSAVKYSKKTVFGKYGSDVALLAGDALLIQGSSLLYDECESLSKEQKKTILSLLSKSLLEISNAEAIEASFAKKFEITPKEYLKIIKSKAVVPELHCKIGAILGKADKDTVEALGNYGRTYGIVSLMREEFIDLVEYQELMNRLQNECLPLPMLYAFQNPGIKKEITSAIENELLTKDCISRIAEIVLGTDEVQDLRKIMDLMIKKILVKLNFLKRSYARDELVLLLEAASLDL